MVNLIFMLPGCHEIILGGVDFRGSDIPKEGAPAVLSRVPRRTRMTMTPFRQGVDVKCWARRESDDAPYQV